MARVVVVGAGVGGLAAAARLATLGHAVTMCEQAPVVGGKLGCYERDGFRFDTGPSLLTMLPVFRDLFAKTGRPLEDALDVVPVDPVTHYRFPDGRTLDVPNTGLHDVAAALDAALGNGIGDDWCRLMDRASAMWQVVRAPVLESPVAGPRDLRRLARPADVRTIAPWATLRGLGRRYLRDPSARLLLERYATYAGSDPRQAPAVLATIPYVEQSFGVHHVRGGLYRLATELAARVTARRGVVRLGADVHRIELDGTRVSGVRLGSGERLPADVVVSDADARHLYAELLPAPRLRRRLARIPPSLAGFSLLLGVRGRTPGLAHHTVLFSGDYGAEFDAIFGRECRPVADPTIYLAVPNDPLVAPPGHEAWFVLVNAPRQRPVDWDAPGVAAAYAERVLDVLATRGYDVRDRLVFREWRTPADLERAARAPGGAIYGTSSNGVRAAFLRPANRSPVPGLYLVGGSAHPGGGLPLVALSAQIVAKLIGPA